MLFRSAWLNLAIAYRATGKLTEASQCMQKAVTLKPDLARGYFTLSPPGRRAASTVA